MLSILEPLTVAGFTVYQDAANDLTATPPKAVGFYVLPNAPSFTVDAGGRPEVSLLVYQAPADSPVRSGGVLQFTVELGLSDAQLDAVRTGLGDLVYGGAPGAGEIPLAPVPLLSARLAVEMAGVRCLDAGALDVAPPLSHAVLLTLSAGGAAALAARHTLPLGLVYRLAFEHQLDLSPIAATCDGAAAAPILRASAAGAPGWDDPAEVAAAALVDAGAVTVAAAASTNLAAPTVDALSRIGREELVRRVRALLAAPAPADGDNAALQKYSADVAAALTFTLAAGTTVPTELTLDADLGDALAQLDWSSLVTTIVLRPPLLRVPVRVRADFAGLPFDSIHVKVTHHGKHDATSEFLFRDSAGTQVFSCWLDDGDAESYDWTARIYYKDSQVTFDLAKSGETAKELTIDVGEAGLLDVTAKFGDLDFVKLPHAALKLRYASRALGANVEHTAMLDQAHPSARFVAPIGEMWSGSFDYQVSWSRADGYRFDRPWATSSAQTVTLVSPIVGALDIAVTPYGDFGAAPDSIAQIALSLRYSDPANHYDQNKQIMITGLAPATASFDLLDATRTDYQYRYSVVHKSGQVSSVPPGANDWLTAQSPAIGVGEVQDIDFTIDPGQLALGTALKLVKVDLSVDVAPQNVHAAKSFVFTPSQKTPAVWKAASGAPAGPRSYNVQITYYGTDGSVTHAPAAAVSDATYVLPPPAPAPTAS